MFKSGGKIRGETGLWALAICMAFAQASFAGSFFDARALAMSGAVDVLADDSSALYYNPAALAQMRRSDLSASYGFLNSPSQQNPILNDLSLGAGTCANWGGAAMGWRGFTQSGIVREQLFSAGAAREFSRKLSLGSALHYSHRNLETNLPKFEEPKSNISVSLGALWKAMPQWQLGVSYEGLNTPAHSAISDEPGTLRCATAYHLRGLALAAQFNVVPSVGTSGRDFEYILAAENWNLSRDFSKSDWALRASFAADSTSLMRAAGGCAFRLKELELDYSIAFPFHALKRSRPDHKISLVYRFGQKKPEKQWRVQRQRVGLQNIIESTQSLPAREVYQPGAGPQELALQIKKIVKKMEFYQKQAQAEQMRVEQLKNNLSRVGFRDLRDMYDAALDQYWALKDNGGLLAARKNYLSTLVEFFSQKNLETKKAQKELDRVQAEFVHQESALAHAWAEYNKSLIDSRPSVFERVEKLNGIIENYAGSGADLSYVKSELISLQ